ncbi:MAG: DUF2252 domain-containing protein [Leucobacter sp.]
MSTETGPSNPYPTADPFGSWALPASSEELMAQGRALRGPLPIEQQGHLPIRKDRDPLGILAEQNATRLQDLVPLRAERMSENLFAFYRGGAAIMAADLAAGPHSWVLVPSCGDAHISNFGFYGSPQRTLVFDLNDFDESAWAPWEWDLKRLIASIVIAGQMSNRDQPTVEKAVLDSVKTYAVAMRAAIGMSPTKRYFVRLDVEASRDNLGKDSRTVLQNAVKHAHRRTSKRATHRLTRAEENGRLRFIETPPTMTRATEEMEAASIQGLHDYMHSTNADVRQLMHHYRLSDMARRVVGVGSVGTRCALALLQDGDGNTLIMQTKQAVTSVLQQYGGVRQPQELQEHIDNHGEGGRVVAMQRILQAVSDPFLGHLQTPYADLYVRQFHDMKGGIDAETLDDGPFTAYSQACAVMLARAHSQSPNAAVVSGYVGGKGRKLGEALVQWGYAYTDLTKQDYKKFLAAHPAK